MFGILATNILDSKVVNNEGKKNGASLVAEEAGRVFALVVAMRGKVRDQFVIGDFAGLG
jgi:hypothetical protein